MKNKKTLSEIVSKAYCVNLYYRTDRWTRVCEQFANHGLNVERFNAIDGREIKRPYSIRPGNAGCNLSHFLIIETAHMMGLEAIMVFEDDAVLAENFVERMNKCLADLPKNWDMLMLGGTHKEMPTPVTDNIWKVNKAFTTHGYIMRSTVYEIYLDRLKAMDMPLDEMQTEIQKICNVYVTNPPMAWQEAGFSDIEGRDMNYTHLTSNDQ